MIHYKQAKQNNITNNRTKGVKMTLQQALNTIENLSQSQGFYGRLLLARAEQPTAFDNWLENLAKGCKDSVDLVIAIES